MLGEDGPTYGACANTSWFTRFGVTSDFQTSDFRDIYLNRIAEKVNQYLSGCVPVDEKYGA